MIGCEKLCGGCITCGPLVWALAALSAGYPLAEVVARRTSFGDAILDPSTLADLLARALRGRGVDVHTHETQRAWAYDCAPGVNLFVALDGEHIGVSWDEPGKYWAHLSDMRRSRAALSRLLAAGLCGPEEAIRLLEGP